MGELVDADLILADTPQEYARAVAYRESQARGGAARKARVDALRGNSAARKDLTLRWTATRKHGADIATLANPVVYEGHGPPTAPPPDGSTYGTWYHDTDSDLLYRWEA